MKDSSSSNGPLLPKKDLEKDEASKTDEDEAPGSPMTREEVTHQVLESASRHIALREKIFVCIAIVGVVAIVAYFVGLNLRSWFNDRNFHSTEVVVSVPSLPVYDKLQLPTGYDGDDTSTTPEPFEDFEGGLNPEIPRRAFQALMKLSRRTKC